MIIGGIDENVRGKIVRLVKALQPDAKIILFGSRARGSFQQSSDVDLAIDVGHELALRDRGEIREVLNASNIIFTFDVVDIYAVNKELQQAIRQEGVEL